MRGALSKTRKAIDAEIARKLRAERTSIATSEGKRFAARWLAILRRVIDGWPNCSVT
jgi:hypothetical protein